MALHIQECNAANIESPMITMDPNNGIQIHTDELYWENLLQNIPEPPICLY